MWDRVAVYLRRSEQRQLCEYRWLDTPNETRSLFTEDMTFYYFILMILVLVLFLNIYKQENARMCCFCI